MGERYKGRKRRGNIKGGVSVKLLSWHKHAIFLTIMLGVGDWLVYKYIVLPFGYPTVAVATFNLILNALALGYSVFAYAQYDRNVEKERKEFAKLGINPPTWQGLAKYLAKELVPSIQVFKSSVSMLKSEGITEDDVKIAIEELKKWAERRKDKIVAEHALSEIEKMGGEEGEGED